MGVGMTEITVELTKDVEAGEDGATVEVAVGSTEDSEGMRMETVEVGVISTNVVLTTALEV